MIIQNVLIQIIQKTPLQNFIGSFQSQEILASKRPSKVQEDENLLQNENLLQGFSQGEN